MSLLAVVLAAFMVDGIQKDSTKRPSTSSTSLTLPDTTARPDLRSRISFRLNNLYGLTLGAVHPIHSASSTSIASTAIQPSTKTPLSISIVPATPPSRRPAASLDLTARRTVLITGGLGYIGSHVCLHLLRTTDYHILVIDNLSNSCSSVLEDILLAAWSPEPVSSVLRARITHLQQDYGDTTALNQLLAQHRCKLGHEVIGTIHLAASKSVAESILFPEKYWENNVIKTARFLGAMKAHGIKKAVLSSSATVYSGLGDITAGERLREEMMPVGGFSQSLKDEQGVGAGAREMTPYGLSKLACEELIQDFAAGEGGAQAAILRLFNPVGCDSSGDLGEDPLRIESVTHQGVEVMNSNLMPMILESLRSGTPQFNVYGTDYNTPDGSCIRDFVHVSDIAEGIVKVFEALVDGSLESGEHCKVYNMASGRGVSVKELVKTVGQAVGKEVEIVDVGRRKGDIAASIGDPERVHRELGWRARRGMKEVARDLCRFHGLC